MRQRPITERLALALFPLNKHHPDLGLVTPDGLACPDGLGSKHEIKDRGYALSGLYFKTGASVGNVPNRTGDWIFSEKDCPGFQHSLARRWLSSFHERTILNLYRKPTGDEGPDCWCERRR